jgi:hypothetical protein
MSGITVLSACFLFVRPPQHLPDLWAVLICVFCCVHFIGFSLLFHLIQFSLTNIEEKAVNIINNEFNFQSCLCLEIKQREKNE